MCDASPLVINFHAQLHPTARYQHAISTLCPEVPVSSCYIHYIHPLLIRTAVVAFEVSKTSSGRWICFSTRNDAPSAQSPSSHTSIPRPCPSVVTSTTRIAFSSGNLRVPLESNPSRAPTVITTLSCTWGKRSNNTEEETTMTKVSSRHQRHAVATTTIDSLVLGVRVYFSWPRAAGDAAVAHAGHTVAPVLTRTYALVCE